MTREIGRYHWIRSLGRGGGGEVHLAHDPRLDRHVAIKMLPEAVARDPDHLDRMEREARLLAAVNHPHIAVIHGLETDPGGNRFLVLEWIEGETLARRLAGGKLSLERTLAFAVEIAEALEAAHAVGIVHRDLKPGNVMIDARDRIKVLDFGLAKRAPGAGSGGEGESAATEVVTSSGVRLGTPGYMSPEQILGEPVDVAADVFSFGCVLYECLAGAPTFPAGRAGGPVVGPLIGVPDWQALPADLEPELHALVRGCLEKDQARRPPVSEVRSVLEGCLARVRGDSRPVAAGRVAHNLPAGLNEFIGRESELGDGRSLIENSRLLTLTGPGGSGKTRLALELASRLRDRFVDGVWLVDLSTVRDEDRLARMVAAVIGVKASADAPLLQPIVDHLRRRQCLLVLDNCEHLARACAHLVEALLQACARLRVLATSREELGLAGEQIYPVPPLSVPPCEPAGPAELANFESVRLFLARARLVDPGFALTALEAPVLAEICRRLEGIPLAIELAAARVRVMALGELLALMDDRLHALSAAPERTVERHRSLAVTLDWSYELLDSEEQRLFRRLSVFVGGWTRETAERVCADRGGDSFALLDRLQRLVVKSLVTVEPSPLQGSRYRMLEILREYARNRLEAAGEMEATVARHRRCFLELAEEVEAKLLGPEQGVHAKILDLEHANLLAALHSALETDGAGSEAARLAAALWRFWYARGEIRLGRELLERAVQVAGQAEPPARARASTGAALLALQLGDADAAERHYEQALALYEDLDDEHGMAGAYNGLGAVAGHGHGNYRRARRHFERSLVLYRRLGDRRGQAIALVNMGEAALREGDHDAARALCEQSLPLRVAEGDAQGVAHTHTHLALALTRQGRVSLARLHLIECFRLIQELRHRARGADALLAVAELAVAERDPARAARFLGAAETVRSQLGLRQSRDEERERKELTARIRELLGGEAVAVALGEGRKLEFDAATQQALVWLASPAAE